MVKHGNTMAILWHYDCPKIFRYNDMRINTCYVFILGTVMVRLKKSERLKMVEVLKIFTIDYGTWDAWSFVTRETLQTLCHSKSTPIHDSIRLQTSLVMSKGGSKQMEMESEQLAGLRRKQGGLQTVFVAYSWSGHGGEMCCKPTILVYVGIWA